MRAFIGVTLAALLGCGSDDADGVFITASWTLRNVESNVPQPCPTEAAWVLLHARGAACPGGECQFDLPCEPGSGLSGVLEPGAYEVWMDFNDLDSSQPYKTFTTTTPETVDLTLGDRMYARQVLLDGGVFKVAWKLVSSQGVTRTCEDGGVYGIYVTANNEADPSSGQQDEIVCEGGFGYTYAYGAGTYTVNLEAVNDSGQTLGLADPLMGQMIVAPNGVTDIGTIEIQLDGN